MFVDPDRPTLAELKAVMLPLLAPGTRYLSRVEISPYAWDRLVTEPTEPHERAWAEFGLWCVPVHIRDGMERGEIVAYDQFGEVMERVSTQ